MGLRRRIKNKIKSIFFGSKDNEKASSSNVMYETPSSPIQSNEREEIEEETAEPAQDTNDDTEEKEEKKLVEDEAEGKTIQKKEINKKEEEVKEEEVKEEVVKKEFEPVEPSKVIDEKISIPEDSRETLVADIKDTEQKMEQDSSYEKSVLQNLFKDEDIEQAVFIYNVSKLDMKHCPNCNAEVFGNWTYEEGKYRCSSCQSVLA